MGHDGVVKGRQPRRVVLHVIWKSTAVDDEQVDALVRARRRRPVQRADAHLVALVGAGLVGCA